MTPRTLELALAVALRNAHAALEEKTNAPAPRDALSALVAALDAAPFPSVVGAQETAIMLKVLVPNLGKVNGLPAPRARLASGPVWMRADIQPLVVRREAAKAARR